VGRDKAEVYAILRDMNADRDAVLEAAEEAVRQGWFDGVVKAVPYKWGIKFGEIHDELVGRGWEAIARAMLRWEPGKSSFISYMFLNVKSKQLKYFKYIHNEKRKHHGEYMFYLGHHQSEDTSLKFEDMLPDFHNVEKEVIWKITLENCMANMSDRDKRIVTMRMRGYSETEITKVFGLSQTRVNRIWRSLKREWQGA